MTTNEIIETFSHLGWTPKKNIDRYADKDIGDRIVQILFKVKDLGVCQKFEASFSIKSPDFTSAVKEVEGGRSEYNDLLKANFKNKVRIQEPEITRSHIEGTCAVAIEWAQSVDINLRYKELSEMDPSTPGAAGVWHLAALALLGNAAKLRTYQASFEGGDRRGFVNFVTKDYIDRAVTIAEQIASG